MLRKNVVRALLVAAVPAQSQRRGLAEAENARGRVVRRLLGGAAPVHSPRCDRSQAEHARDQDGS